MNRATTTVRVDDITLGIESFGDDGAPLVLLVGGPTMLSWPDALCERLAAGGRRAVRYDLRDSGASTTADPSAPAYTLRDLAADAAALAGALGGAPAHLAGIGIGGMVAQVAVLDHPGALSALTLVGTRAVAPGPTDDDLPDHDGATMSRLFARPMPDWADREAVADFAAAGAEVLGNDPVAARATAARVWDRTPGTAPPVQMANQLGMVFSRLDCGPRWRERLPGIEVPTLVVHGRRDPFFPVGNGEAIAREIPGARLLVLDEAATAIPDAEVGAVAEAMLALGSRTRDTDRTDRAGRVIAASPEAVYGALLDRKSLEAWLPPDGMSGRIERWDPRPGGGFRMTLTYLDAAGSPGKSSDATDVVDVEFADLAPSERLVTRAVFEADDPAFAGTMTMTWHLAPAGDGTEVTVTATGVPPGIDQTVHEAGIASSLANLASYVEGAG